MRGSLDKTRDGFENENTSSISPSAMAIVVDNIKKREALKGLNFNCLVISHDKADQSDEFILLLRTLEQNKEDYPENMRFQVVLNKFGHWAAIDIQVKNNQLEFFLIDAAHSSSHVRATVIALHTHCPQARITYSGGYLQADTSNCAYFAVDHALAMAKLPDLHENLAPNVYQKPYDENDIYNDLHDHLCTISASVDEAKAFQKIKFVDIFDFPLHFGSLLKNTQFYSKYEELIKPKNFLRTNGRPLNDYIDSHTEKDDGKLKNVALMHKRAKIKGYALDYLNNEVDVFSRGKIFNMRQTLPYGLNKPDLDLQPLIDTVRRMKAYGEEISKKDALKGQMVKKHADTLLRHIDRFRLDNICKHRYQINYRGFEKQFRNTLHSKDNEMTKHRDEWKIILANIAIALTGIGALAVAGKALHSKITTGSPSLFFSQTKSKKAIEEVDGCLTQVCKMN